MAGVEVSVTSEPCGLPARRLLLYWGSLLLLLLLLVLLLLGLALTLPLGLLAGQTAVLIPQVDRLIVVMSWVSPC